MQLTIKCVKHQQMLKADPHGYFDMAMTYQCPSLDCKTRVMVIMGPSVDEQRESEDVMKHQAWPERRDRS